MVFIPLSIEPISYNRILTNWALMHALPLSIITIETGRSFAVSIPFFPISFRGQLQHKMMTKKASMLKRSKPIEINPLAPLVPSLRLKNETTSPLENFYSTA
jgi:hypothetical protein